MQPENREFYEELPRRKRQYNRNGIRVMPSPQRLVAQFCTVFDGFHEGARNGLRFGAKSTEGFRTKKKNWRPSSFGDRLLYNPVSGA